MSKSFNWFVTGLALLVIGLMCLGQQPRAAGFLLLAKAGSGGTCTESTTFKARTSGLTATEISVYDSVICGLVSDNNWASIEALYWFATNTEASALLNLKSTSYSATNSSVTFTADLGYSGGVGFIDTSFIPSAASIMAKDSASVGAMIQTNGDGNWNDIGVGDGTNFIKLNPLNGGAFQPELNGATFPTQAGATSKGMWIVSRTGSTNILAYGPSGSSTPLGTFSDTSTGLPTGQSIYLLSFNVSGVSTAPSSRTMTAAFFGSGLTGAQAAAISSRLNAGGTLLGINVY